MKYIANILLLLIGATLFAQNNHIEFRENKGQWHDNVLYKARIPGGNLYLEQNALTYQFYKEQDIVRMGEMHHDAIKNPQHSDSIIHLHAFQVEFLNAKKPNLIPSLVRSDYENYFRGKDNSKWASQVKKYEEIEYQKIYENIGLKFYLKNNFLKYDFNVMPGGNPQNIQLNYNGVNDITIKNGNLYIKTSLNEIIEQKPYAYQIINGKEKEVKCNYKLEGTVLSFDFPKGYKKEIPLIIDPTLIFASYSGATVDNWGYTSTFDDAGHLYGGGVSFGVGYPTTTGAYQILYGGGNRDISISKFSPDGTALVYSTYLGGSNVDSPHSLIVNSNNELLIFGTTNSTDFPVTGNGFDTSQNGGYDIFVTKLNTNGSVLLGSTFIGGSLTDGLNSAAPLKRNYADDHRGEIIIDANDNIYIASTTSSSDFPTTTGVFQATSAGALDACIFKLSPDLNTLLWSTYMGGTNSDAAYSLQLNGLGQLLITGGTNSPNFPVTAGTVHSSFQGGSVDGWVAKINNTATSIIASTFIGTGSYDQSYFVQADTANNIYVVGQTEGVYPITPATVYNNPNSGQFIHKYTPDLTTTVFSTTFGRSAGTIDISLSAFLVNECNYILVSGWGGVVNFGLVPTSTTTGLPVTANALQPTTDGSDYYLTMFSENADTILYATFFGGNASFDHVDGGTSRFDKKGIVYQAVCSSCGGATTDFPTTPGAWSNTDNSNNCNLGVFKLDLSQLTADAEVYTTPFYCVGDTVHFQNLSNGGFSYFWDFGDGSTSTLFEPFHAYNAVGTYRVMLVALDSISCIKKDTDYVDVFIGGPPTVSFTPVSGICRGDSTQLNITGGTSYAWLPNYNILNSNTNAPTVWPDTTTIYTVITTDSCGIDTSQVTVTVFQSPVSVSPNISVCWGQSVQIFASGGVSYSWVPDPTLNNPNIANPFVTPSVTTTYNVTVTDINTCVWDTFITITTDFIPPVANASMDTLMCLGDTIQLTTSGGVNYSWTPTNSIVNPTSAVVSVYPSQNTYYIVEASNACGQDYDTIFVEVHFVLADAWPDTSVCPNQEIQLFSSGGNILSWTPANEIYQVAGNYFTRPSTPSTYTVTVEDSLGCQEEASLSVGIRPPPLLDLGEDQWLIEDSLLLTAIGAGSFLWTPSNFVVCDTCQITSVFPNETTTFTVVLTDTFGCVNSDQITIYVTSEIWIPNAFTPDGDGINDLFMLKTFRIEELELYIFDRWGELLFQTTDKTQGWDGTYKGNPVKTEAYVWKIKYKDINGKPGKRYGTITLIR